MPEKAENMNPVPDISGKKIHRQPECRQKNVIDSGAKS